MTEIRVKTDIKGKIKPVHGVGQPPFEGMDYSMIHWLRDAGIPFSRLHDVGGIYGGGRFVDIPNIFRNFDAEAEDPASYDFAFTDTLIKALEDNDVEPFFRLGVTIENYHYVKAYRIHPPKDYKKWAVICEKIIRHYTEGWADGFYYNIRYWEIWNEADNGPDATTNQMWTGNAEDYYRLYEVASKHLKECFPDKKIGGYASCGFYQLHSKNERNEYFMTFFEGFLAYVKSHSCPLDFFSWHSYDSIEHTMDFADFARRRLDEEGFTETETTCNEWNCEVGLRGTSRHAVLTAAMMCAMQDSPLDSAMFYDARWGTSIYGSLFNPLTKEPFPSYYAFPAFNELYKLGNECTVTGAEEGVYACAATDGKRKTALLVCNTTGEAKKISISMEGENKKCRILNAENLLAECEIPDEIPAETALFIEAE